SSSPSFSAVRGKQRQRRGGATPRPLRDRLCERKIAARAGHNPARNTQFIYLLIWILPIQNTRNSNFVLDEQAFRRPEDEGPDVAGNGHESRLVARAAILKLVARAFLDPLEGTGRAGRPVLRQGRIQQDLGVVVGIEREFEQAPYARRF